MNNFDSLARVLFFTGVLLLVTGAVVWLAGRIPGLDRLPGTLRFQWQGFSCVFPVLGSIVLSLLLTLLLNLIIRMLNK